MAKSLISGLKLFIVWMSLSEKDSRVLGLIGLTVLIEVTNYEVVTKSRVGDYTVNLRIR